MEISAWLMYLGTSLILLGGLAWCVSLAGSKRNNGKRNCMDD